MDMLYAKRSAIPTDAATDAMFRITPPPRSLRLPIEARMQW